MNSVRRTLSLACLVAVLALGAGYVLAQADGATTVRAGSDVTVVTPGGDHLNDIEWP